MIRKWYWDRYLSRSNVRPLWQELDNFRSLSPGEARSEIATRLLNQIRYFGSRADALPQWREAASLKDPQDIWRIWTSLPILSKGDLKTRFHPTEMKERFNLNGVASSTGGS